MNQLAAEFRTLKNSGNVPGLLRLVTKIEKMPRGRTTPVVTAITNIMNNRFAQAINEVSPILTEKRGVAIVAAVTSGEYPTHSIKLVKDGKDIAGMKVHVDVRIQNGRVSRELELSSGWTLPNYAKNGPMRPSNGPGYGTILRALIVSVAKKEGFIAVTQTSAIVSPENKNRFARGLINRPASAWIMNKLGFNIKNVNRDPVNGRVKAENRVLKLNKSTPKLNAITRNVLGGQTIAPNRRRWWAPPWSRTARVV